MNITAADKSAKKQAASTEFHLKRVTKLNQDCTVFKSEDISVDASPIVWVLKTVVTSTRLPSGSHQPRVQPVGSTSW